VDPNALVKVASAANEAEAEFVRGVLLAAGVPSVVRRSADADVPDYLAAGARDVLVPSYLAETARQLLPHTDCEPATPRSEVFDSPLRVAAGVALLCVGVALVIWLGIEFVWGAATPVAIVTGGSCGTGRELARNLAARGYAIVVVYLHDQREAEAVVDEILAAMGTAVSVRADLTDELDVERLFDEAGAAFDGVDVVVHADRRGTRVVYEQAARQLRQGGAIVSISTTDEITSGLASRLHARDITVNGLAPGLEPPGRDHDVGELVSLLDRWRPRPAVWQ
jgi:3-oxoacyl-[acyl-carrier protein] reductase